MSQDGYAWMARKTSMNGNFESEETELDHIQNLNGRQSNVKI